MNAGDGSGPGAVSAAGGRAGPALEATNRARPPARRLVPWVLVIVIAAVVVTASGRGSGRGAALDPGATGATGAKGLALLIGRLGGSLDTSGTLPPARQGVTLVLADHLSAAARHRVGAWAGAGGTLVVADPSSDLAGVAPAQGPSPNSGIGAEGPLPPDCDAPWAQGVDRVDTAGVALLARPVGATAACFDAAGAFFAVERPAGAGRIISLAGPDLWTNHYLGRRANSVLAANLLVPEPATTVAWLVGTGPGGGHRSLLSLLPARVDELLIGLAVAFVVVAGWQGRRLGRPVPEEAPVVVPGSELVGAVSRLLARNDERSHAAELLRSGARRAVTATMAVDPSMEPATVSALVAERVHREPAWVTWTLYGPPPADDAALVGLARAVEDLRREVRGVHT